MRSPVSLDSLCYADLPFNIEQTCRCYFIWALSAASDADASAVAISLLLFLPPLCAMLSTNGAIKFWCHWLSFSRLISCGCKDAVWQTLAIVNSIHAHTLDGCTAHSIQFYMALVFLLSLNPLWSEKYTNKPERAKCGSVYSIVASKWNKKVHLSHAKYLHTNWFLCLRLRSSPPTRKRGKRVI